MLNNEMEIWKTYPEYQFIQGNRLGEIRTVDRYVSDGKGGKRFVKGRILKQQRLPKGYLYVVFKVNGKLVNRYVHRLVAQMFIHNPNNLPEVNHKDNNPLNNNASNLEWCTHEYNMAYKEKYGVSSENATKVLRKPLFAVNLKTEKVSRFPSQIEAARQLRTDRRSIGKVLTGRYKQTGGYWFTNADSNAVENTKSKFGNEVADKVAELMSESILV